MSYKKPKAAALLPCLLFSVICLSIPAYAATDLFFMAPVSGEPGNSVVVSFILKGERLQSGAVDFLYDSRLVSPEMSAGNLIRVDKGPLASQGSPFFFAASLLETLYDETRPYLRTIRFSFAFQTPVNSEGADELAYFHFNLDNMQPGGFTLLQVIKNSRSMGDLDTYRQGGGIIFCNDGSVLPSVTIDSPVNEQRYEDSAMNLRASVGASLPELPQPAVFWVDPFTLTEPLGDGIIVASGPEATVNYETGIHAVLCLAAETSGNINSAWSVFGIREDVIVTVFGAIKALVIESTSNEPVTGATVLLFEGDTIITSCFTGSDGICLFEGLEEGIYVVEARKDYYEGYSTTVTVPKDETVQVTLPILSLVPPSDQIYEYTSLHVCVHQDSESGAGIAGARVREMRGSYSCTTGQDGCCYIDRVRRDVDLYWYAENGKLFSSITGPVRFSASQEELSLTVTAATGTAIRLQAVDPFNSHAPIPDIEATLETSSGNSISRVTDSAGEALLSPVSSSVDYSLMVKTPTQTGPDNISWYAGQTLTISHYDTAEGRVLPVTLPFTGMYTRVEEITGHDTAPDPSRNPEMEIYVTDLSNQPLYSVSIKVMQNGVVTGTYLTDGNGKVHVTGLLPGTVRVSAAKQGLQGVRFEEVLTAGIIMKRYIRLGRVISSVVEYRAIQGGGGDSPPTICPALIINVKNPSSGLAVPGLDVRITGMVSGTVVYSGQLDANGTAMLTNLDLDELPLEVRLSKDVTPVEDSVTPWTEINVMTPVSAKDGYITSYTFYFQPDSTMLAVTQENGQHPLLASGTFIVRDENDRPLPEIPVTVRSIDDGKTFDIETDSQGHAYFQHDLPGRYHIITTRPGYQGVDFEISMGIGSLYTFDIGLQTIPTIFRPVYDSCSGGSLPGPEIKSLMEVLVMNASTGQPMPGTSLTLYDASGAETAWGTTDNSGKWTQTGLDSASGSLLEAYWRSSRGSWEELLEIPCDLRQGMKTLITAFATPDSGQVSGTPFTGDDSSGSSGVSLLVVDRLGSAIYRAKITICKQDGLKLRSIYTNDDGQASINGIEPGIYSITIEKDGAVSVFISSVSIWRGSVPEWRVTVPETMNHIKRTTEPALENARLEALVVNGESFHPLAGVTVEISPAGSQTLDFPGTTHTDSSGRLVINGLDRAGAVWLTLSMNNYMERHENPIHLNSGEVRYALYALTPEHVVKRIRNADNVPAGKTFWFPQYGRGIVQKGAGLTLFSYDYAMMSIRKKSYVDLTSPSSLMLGAAAFPVIPGDTGVSFNGYLVAVKEASSLLNLYQYRPGAGDAITMTASITAAGEINDAMLSGTRLLLATSSGIFFYDLNIHNNVPSPMLRSSINLPAIRVEGSGTDILAVTDKGQVVGIDAATWEMPIFSSLGTTPYLPCDAVSTSAFLLMTDEKNILHTAKVSGRQAFGVTPSGSQATPSLWFSGQEQLNMQDISVTRLLAVGARTYAYCLTGSGVAMVEITDNAMLHAAFFPMPAPPEDIVFTTRRIGDTTEPCGLVFTDMGVYSIPMPEGSRISLDWDFDVTDLMPAGNGPRYVWTSLGYVQPLEQQTINGSVRYFWKATLQPGIYDISFTDSAGRSLFDFYQAAISRDAEDSLKRIYLRLDLMHSDGSRAAGFMPGQGIYVNMGIDVFADTVADAYMVMIFQPDGGTQKYYCPAAMEEDGFFNITACYENMAGVRPFRSSWPVTPVSGMRTRLMLVPDGDYSGSGMVSFFLTAPGAQPDDADAVYGNVETPFRITP